LANANDVLLQVVVDDHPSPKEDAMLKDLDSEHCGRPGPAIVETSSSRQDAFDFAVAERRRNCEREIAEVERERDALKGARCWCLSPKGRRSLTWQLDEIGGRLSSLQLELYALLRAEENVGRRPIGGKGDAPAHDVAPCGAAAQYTLRVSPRQ
jgi:hypothetical protein